MAKTNHSMSAQQMLVVFLLVIAVVSFAGLYFDVARKNRDLTKEVQQLRSSQVLLMVPDEQAADIAAWLTQHPDKTKALAQKAASGEQITLTLGPGANSSIAKPEKALVQSQTESINQIVENAQGVKVIPLAHGGIRVTTRETELTNKHQ